MQATCQGPGCGRIFEAKRPSARYCSPKCRQRGHRSPAARDETPEKPAPVRRAPPDGLVAATEAKLAAAVRLDGPEGQAAMVLAARIEHGEAETGASVASLVKQYHATMAEALKDGEAASPLDELRARRERRFAADG
jgi:hypothetical protein